MITDLKENSLIVRSECVLSLSVYTLAHALVDASCAAIIAANISGGMNSLSVSEFSFYILLYNTIAFSFQVPLGVIADNIRKPAKTAVAGFVLIIVSLATYKTASIAIIISGIGNALFHVSGGMTVLNLKPGKASLPGIYVASGAIGLLIGTLFGKSIYFSIWPLIIILISLLFAFVKMKTPKINYNMKIKRNINRFNIILICILGSIAIRGLVGFMLAYSWKSNFYLLLLFTLAIAFGKALGGVLGDCFGWTRVTIYGLLASAPLLIAGKDLPFFAICGVFLFNLTMPITLTVISDLLPGRSGFAFGLTTLALIVGALPAFTGLKTLCENNGKIIFGATILMVLLLKIGLKLFFSKSESETVSAGDSFNIKEM